MTMDEIFEEVVILAENDQSISETNVLNWCNQALQRINVALQAKIPLIVDTGLTVPAIDPRYHEALILFSVAKYRESDSSYNDANYFMGQFNDMVATMQRDMVIPPSQRGDYNIQQIIVPDSNTYLYALTIPDGSYYDDIKVYHNDVEIRSFNVDSANRRINISATIPLVSDDKLTVIFENNSDLNAAPYQWWTF